MKRAFTIHIRHDLASWLGQKKNKTALIVFGGSEEHHPKEVAEILAALLREEYIDVQLSNSLDIFRDEEKLKQVDLIVLIWTRGTITQEQLNPLLAAIKAGTGFVGIHASVGAFRGEIGYHEMIGGQFLDHPGGADSVYEIRITDPTSPIMKGIENFKVKTEKYYMLIDPSITVLAETSFGDVVMPMMWTKNYGKGHVFYNSLGHTMDIVTMPQVLGMMKRGMLWAMR
ncbi:ThuA domain-containing protein [Paenibacillus aceris]|uniref:Type 1 glutamine amidotransferase n=1 Tax=Paenibacillus aceris TaxID=869555 RepID=A0ABS4I0W5_9BACL|nr:ThuA domain-containing protein [Paenibacillus aceris]MBP1964564.1 type 1 glutamine amidotransferase [Paenibacillus aceris]NHW35727.1 hypothetical protein [Paenibacillus aceris]